MMPKWSPERLKLCTLPVLHDLLAQAEGNAVYLGDKQSRRHFVWMRRADVVREEIASRNQPGCFECGHDICICNLPSNQDLQNWNEANDYVNEGDYEN